MLFAKEVGDPCVIIYVLLVTSTLYTMIYYGFYFMSNIANRSVRVIRNSKTPNFHLLVEDIQALYGVFVWTGQQWLIYRQTSKIERTWGHNEIVDLSDVAGASTFGTAPTTSSLST